jgi:pyrophosphatase PpaX
LRLKFNDKSSIRPFPGLIIFDVDGVLVDTRGSFQKTTLETVGFFTGKRVTRDELHRWKNRPGFNDDWKLSHAWVNALGRNYEFEVVKAKFLDLYWGKNADGNVVREKWILSRTALMRLRQAAELAIFTGRVQKEMEYTLRSSKLRNFFQSILTVEDVARSKPDPEGLLKILNGRKPEIALYIGDNVDDALAAQAAGIRFVGVLPRRSLERRHRIASLRQVGAETILGSIRELESYLKKLPSPTR